MTKITLKIDGEDKVFTQDFVPWNIRRRAMELEIEGTKGKSDPLEYLDLQADFIVSFFGGQFTRQQLENGLDVSVMSETIYSIIGVSSLGMPTKEEAERLGKQREKAEKEALKNKQK